MEFYTKAIGQIETLGLSNALYAADTALKAGNIDLINLDVNNPKKGEEAPIAVCVQVRFEGMLSDVKAATDAGFTAALERMAPEDCAFTIIANPMCSLLDLLSNSKMKRKHYIGVPVDCIGIIEIFTFTACVQALQMCVEGFNVSIISVQKYLGGQMSTIILGGRNDDIRWAVESVQHSNMLKGYVKSAECIGNPHPQIMDFIS